MMISFCFGEDVRDLLILFPVPFYAHCDCCGHRFGIRFLRWHICLLVSPY